MLKGVSFDGGSATTESISMRSRSGTVRRVEARHAFEKLEQLSGGRYA